MKTSVMKKTPRLKNRQKPRRRCNNKGEKEIMLTISMLNVYLMLTWTWIWMKIAVIALMQMAGIDLG